MYTFQETPLAFNRSKMVGREPKPPAGTFSAFGFPGVPVIQNM
jgi:hypothetical protein